MGRSIQRQEGLSPEVYLPLVDFALSERPNPITSNFMCYLRCFHHVLEDGRDPSFVLHTGDRYCGLCAWLFDLCLFAGAADSNNEISRETMGA